MKELSIRAFVLFLSIAGIASTVNAKTPKGKTVTVSGPTHDIVPNCLPHDPNHCGLD